MPIILTESDLKGLYGSPAGIDDLLNLVEESLREHSRNEVVGQTIVETSALGPGMRYRIMSAAVPGAGYGMRISALFDGAKDAYFHLLFEEESGDLLALVAGRELNIWRTGAPAGVACRYLAPAETTTLGILGTGRQARGQLMAIHRSVPSLETVRVYSPIQAHRIRFVNEMRAWLGIDVEPVSSPREALWDADIVSIATNSPAPVLDANWISPGALVISLSNGQLPKESVTNSRVIVSWKEEILSAERPRQPYAAMIAAGTWSGSQIIGELGEIILGRIAGRQKIGDTVLFDSVGMPSWDTTAVAWAYRWANEHQVGSSFSLD